MGGLAGVGEIPVACSAELLIRNHRAFDVGLVADVLVAGEEGVEVGLSEVACVLEHDVKHNLEALGVGGVDEVLEFHVLLRAPFGAALVAEVDARHVHGVVAVVVYAGAVLHHGCDPDGGESEGLDVVELLDKTCEVAAPCGVVGGNLLLLLVPGADVVLGVAVIEAGGHREIDGLVAEVRTLSHESRGHRGQRHKECERYDEPLCQLSHLQSLVNRLLV